MAPVPYLLWTPTLHIDLTLPMDLYPNVDLYPTPGPMSYPPTQVLDLVYTRVVTTQDTSGTSPIHRLTPLDLYPSIGPSIPNYSCGW